MRIEAETPDPSSFTISTNPAAEVSSPESTILDSQEAPDDSDAKSALKNLRLRNVGRLTIGYLNINSIRNKFDPLKEIVSQNLDILMVGKQKLMILSQKNNSILKVTLIHCDLIEMMKVEVCWYT